MSAAGEPGRAATHGLTDLTELLLGLDPELDPVEYVFATVAPGSPTPAGAVVRVEESEGVTVVVPTTTLRLDATARATSSVLRRITLRVHSSLDAVGLTATVAAALAAAGISCNVVAGFHHDHLFVPADRVAESLAILRALTGRAQE